MKSYKDRIPACGVMKNKEGKRREKETPIANK